MRLCWLLVASTLCGCAGDAPKRATPPPARPASSAAALRTPTAAASTRATSEVAGAAPLGSAKATPAITAVAGLQKIRLAPRHDADVIGVFRAGQSLTLAKPEPLPVPAPCEGGWYAVLPRGFVCANGHTSLTADSLRARAARAVLPADAAYPFRYGRAVGSPRYLRFPTLEEQRKREPGLDAHLATEAADATAAETKAKTSVALRSYFEREGPLADALPAYPGMKLSWASEIAARGRSWLVTPELLLIPKDKVTQQPELATVSRHLDKGGAALPFALVLEATVRLQRKGAALADEGSWPQGALVPLRASERGLQLSWRTGRKLAATSSGHLIAAADASLFAARSRPSGVGAGDKWVHVSVIGGTLVAYRGDAPVFAAAISAGAHGVDPKGEYRTPPGRYRISSKWLTSDMGGSLGEAGSWRSRDVPWVAYYDGSYALHGAWWHDRFGRPRSHGCTNLTPADARWLFRWLEPELPAGWYGVRASRQAPGTLLVISR